MDASVDTNILIHLYNACSEELLFSSFAKVYAYEYIIDEELSANDKNVHAQVEEDIKNGKIIKVTNAFLINRGAKELFDENYNDFRILFAGDRGEAYAIALASVMGIESFVSDDTKDGGPYETLLKELIDNVIPFTYYELLFLKYLKGELDCLSFKSHFDRISSKMSHPMNFTPKIKKVLYRYHKDYSSDRDYEWLYNFCCEHSINLNLKIKELVKFL